MLYAALQSMILSLALGFALWQLWGRLAPQLRASQQRRLALVLMSPASPRWLNRLGWRLMPSVDSACGSGCSRCGTCPTT